MKSTVIETTDISRFVALVNRGIEAWVEAGQLLCQITEHNPCAYSEILDNNPHLTRDILESFERIGRHEIYPYLLVDGSPGARKLAGLPYKSQVKLYGGTVLIVKSSRGGFEQRRKKIADLTGVEAALVFDSVRVRTADEQIKLLRAHVRRKIITHSSFVSSESEMEEQTGEPLDLKGNPRAELARLLTAAHSTLLNARTELAMLKRGSKKDEHITRALQEIGHLRLAVNENDL